MMFCSTDQVKGVLTLQGEALSQAVCVTPLKMNSLYVNMICYLKTNMLQTCCAFLNRT